MTRTQIQLTEDQMRRVRALAQKERVSIAEVIRRAVVRMLEESDQEQRWRKERALGAVGRFASGLTDVSRRHDTYLEDAFDPR